MKVINFNLIIKNIIKYKSADFIQPVWILDFTEKQYDYFFEKLVDNGYTCKQAEGKEYLELKNGLIIYRRGK